MKFGDIIEYEDCTYSQDLENAREWCKANNGKLVELIDRREEKTITEEYEEEYEEEVREVIPAVTHEEEIDGQIVVVTDEEERVEVHYETKTRPATREFKKLYRYFEIVEN